MSNRYPPGKVAYFDQQYAHAGDRLTRYVDMVRTARDATDDRYAVRVAVLRRIRAELCVGQVLGMLICALDRLSDDPADLLDEAQTLSELDWQTPDGGGCDV